MIKAGYNFYRFFLFVVLFLGVQLSNIQAQLTIEKHLITSNTAGGYIKAYIYPYKSLRVKPEKDVIYYYYQGSKISYNQGGYTGHLLHGKSETISSDKTLLEQGHFLKGVRQGTWKRWYANGNLANVSQWRKGRKHGLCWTYDKAGILTEKARYKKGLLHGKVSIIERGTIIQKKKYKKGEEHIKEEKVKKEKHKSKKSKTTSKRKTRTKK